VSKRLESLTEATTEKSYSRPLTKIELADYLRVSPRTIDYYIAGRKIPFIKLGPRLVRFRLADVERALKRYTVEEISLS
jgi:excisionase family DNA binding protein